MVERAISGNPHFELSLIEMYDHGLSYTYHTLENLRKQNPDTDYYFIIGADSLGYLGIERLEEMVGGLNICKGCFTGTYPMEPPKEDIRGDFER